MRVSRLRWAAERYCGCGLRLGIETGARIEKVRGIGDLASRITARWYEGRMTARPGRPQMPAGNERVLIERLIAGMRAVIDELPRDERQCVIEAIRAVDREIANWLESPPNKTH
jgi:hypothetical protein